MRPVHLALALASLAGCATVRGVRPAGEDRTTVDASLGGPLLQAFGGTFPVPTLQVGVVHGLTDRTDLSATANLTAASFGIAAVEVGAAHQLTAPSGAAPAVSGQAAVLALVGRGGGLVAPAVGLTVSWDLGSRLVGYLGALAAATRGEDPDGTGRLDLHLAPYAGAAWRPGGGRWTMTLELRWYDPQRDLEPLAPEWLGIAGHGALAPLLSVGRDLGGRP